MPMPVVTFSAQAGSDGFSIARAVAIDLDYLYYDWQITSKAEQRISRADATRVVMSLT